MSSGFVCQNKKVNSCGHIPEHLEGQVEQWGSISTRKDKFICGESIDESAFGCSLQVLFNFDVQTKKPATDHVSSPF